VENEKQNEASETERHERVTVSLADDTAYAEGYRQGFIDILFILLTAALVSIFAYRLIVRE
jgi:hypothetical protein